MVALYDRVDAYAVLCTAIFMLARNARGRRPIKIPAYHAGRKPSNAW
jgi:hypothetical protein